MTIIEHKSGTVAFVASAIKAIRIERDLVIVDVGGSEDYRLEYTTSKEAKTAYLEIVAHLRDLT